MTNDTLNRSAFPWSIRSLFACVAACVALCTFVSANAIEAPGDIDEDAIEIIEGEDRTIYEYRQNGVLTMIKVVPDNGRAYYMVPADGSAHYEGLDHKKNLYPQWVIVEW